MKSCRFLLLLVAACSTEVAGGDAVSCPPGEVEMSGACEKLCLGDFDCATGTVCGREGICVPGGGGAAPRIDSVTGDGPVDGAPGYGANRIRTGLVILGEHLAGATVALEGATLGLPSFAELNVRLETDERLDVDLPGEVAPGTYLLTVTNAAGSDQVTVPMLRGETGADGADGADGSCDPTACTTRIYPGASLVSSLTLRAANPAGAGIEQSFALDGVEQIGAPSNGVWLGIIDRGDHALVTSDPDYNRVYDVSSTTQLTALVIELAGLDGGVLAVLVSRGDVAAAINQDVGGSTLASQMIALGASPTIRSLRAGEAFAFAGAFGLGAGNGSLVVSGTGAADSQLTLVDGMLIGTSTADRLGATIESAEITDGTIAAIDIGDHQITGAKLDGSTAGTGLVYSGDRLAIDTTWLGEQSCGWYPNATGYVNNFDAAFTFSCPSKYYLAGVHSYHDNGTEDRRFRFYCCRLFP
jgi:hypothetical protein